MVYTKVATAPIAANHTLSITRYLTGRFGRCFSLTIRTTTTSNTETNIGASNPTSGLILRPPLARHGTAGSEREHLRLQPAHLAANRRGRPCGDSVDIHEVLVVPHTERIRTKRNRNRNTMVGTA